MTKELLPITAMAFSTGLLATGHCLGMCGGLVAAFSLGRQGTGGVFFHFFYNLGRLATYSAIGFLAGWIGSVAMNVQQLRELTRILLLGADLCIIVVGLGSAGILPYIGFSRLESGTAASIVTRAASRLRRLPSAALPLGLVMGFLPCGVLYTWAMFAAQTGSAVAGAMVMASFGAGTFPALFFFGLLSSRLRASFRGRLLQAAGILVAAAGFLNFYRHLRSFFL